MRRLVALFGAASLVMLAFLAYPFISLLLSVEAEPLRSTFALSEVREALLLTLALATLAVLILIFIGVPLAYILARFEFRGKGLVEGLVDLPFVIPHAVVGVMLLVAYGPRTPIGGVLRSLGLVVENSPWAIVAVFVFVGAPLLIDTVRDGFSAIDPYLEGVARCLGAGPFRTFLTVSLPLASRSLATGVVLAWARAVSEVGALLIIAYYPKTINVLIVEWFNTYGLAYATSLTLTLLPISVGLFLLLRWALGWGR